MAAHDPRLWETLQEFSQNLAIWTSQRMLVEQTGNLKMASLISEALDFALPKALKDSDFKLKTEQKLIIEAVVELFTPFARTVTFLKNFQQIFLRRTSSQSGVTSICFSFPARFSFIPSFPKLLIVS